IGSAVDFILKRRNIARLDLLGWSWGTTLMATYTTQNASKVERLVLYAPVWIRTTASLVQTGPGPTPPYRSVKRGQAPARRLTGAAQVGGGGCGRKRGRPSFPRAGSTSGRAPLGPLIR